MVEGLSHKRRWRDWQQMKKNGLKLEESSTPRRKSKEEKVSKLTFQDGAGECNYLGSEGPYYCRTEGQANGKQHGVDVVVDDQREDDEQTALAPSSDGLSKLTDQHEPNERNSSNAVS